MDHGGERAATGRGPSRRVLRAESYDGVGVSTAVHDGGRHHHGGSPHVFVGVDLTPGVHLRASSAAASRVANVDGPTAPDRVHLVPAGADSTWVHDEPITTVQVRVDRSVWERDAASDHASRSGDLRPHFGRRDRLAVQAVLLLRDAAHARTPDPLFVSGLTAALVARLSRPSNDLAAAPVVVDGRWLTTVLDFVEASLHLPLHVSDIAAAAGCTPYELARRLRVVGGQSPYELVTARRVARAQRLLADPTLTLAEVAEHCGFYDQSHLGRHFTRRIGASPAAYRRGLGVANVPAADRPRRSGDRSR